MKRQGILKTGTVFAATVGIGYAACTLVFWLVPDAAANFMNALFHGLDFRKLQAGGSIFTLGSFLYAEIVLVGWAFGLGCLSAWLGRQFNTLEERLA